MPTECDVCIVGAGPAGLTAALRLGEVGREVVVLESGLTDSTQQDLNEGEYSGEPYVGLIGSRHRQVGGTVNIWNVRVGGRSGAKYVPLAERDLAAWPIEWAELEPFYHQAQAVCGLGPFQYGPGYWATPERRPFDLAGTALTNGVYQFGFGSRFCTDLPQSLGALDSVTLLPGATVVGLERGVGGVRPTSVRAVLQAGDAVLFRPRAVILACGAVETARLLLLAGYGADLPLLGRGFMEHARDFSLSMVPHSPELFSAASFYDLHESRNGSLVGGRLALTDEALDAHRLPNASITLFPRPRTDLSVVGRLKRALGRSAAVRHGPYGWSETSAGSSSYADFKVILNVEQQPDLDNRVALSDRTDRFGNRLPSLVLRWSSQEQKRLDRLRELVAESLQAADLGTLRFELGLPPDLSAHHHAGTTKMASSRNDGVVDSSGRLFGSENVFVAGASVFPSAGFANPTLTIVAIAIRLADHIDRYVA